MHQHYEKKKTKNTQGHQLLRLKLFNFKQGRWPPFRLPIFPLLSVRYDQVKVRMLCHVGWIGWSRMGLVKVDLIHPTLQNHTPPHLDLALPILLNLSLPCHTTNSPYPTLLYPIPPRTPLSSPLYPAYSYTPFLAPPYHILTIPKLPTYPILPYSSLHYLTLPFLQPNAI
jgi:hypothetical protein